MNEYRWYTDKQTETQPSAPINRPHTVLWSALTSAVICAVALTIFAGVFNASHKSSSYYDDGRAKTDISEYITPTNGETLSVAQISDTVGPCVVGILANEHINSILGSADSSGSGVIISEDGYILTNNHVVENATDLTVVLNDNSKYSATLVGRDSTSDLAVLKIQADNLHAAVMGDSDAVKTGELAVAIGNPLGQKLAGSVTAGVISSADRKIDVDGKQMELLQTDAAINPGNSGGALVNCYGEVIGINTVKVSSTSIEGIGFAIPINSAKPIVEDLIRNGKITGRPSIGIMGSNGTYGIVVEKVTDGSAAANAGIMRGDMIVKINGETVTTVAELNAVKNKFKSGDVITLTVYRSGELLDIDVTLDEAEDTDNN